MKKIILASLFAVISSGLIANPDKPKKPNNPNPSGKTDYMKRRQKELTETILAKLKK